MKRIAYLISAASLYAAFITLILEVIIFGILFIFGPVILTSYVYYTTTIFNFKYLLLYPLNVLVFGFVILVLFDCMNHLDDTPEIKLWLAI